jgi:hypothetical protein
VSRFLDDARAILEAAESASRSGHAVSDFTMLIGRDGAIRILAASDWPLDRLLAERNARAAYRVGESNDRIRVEARTASQSCRIESDSPQRAVRELLFSLRSFNSALLPAGTSPLPPATSG